MRTIAILIALFLMLAPAPVQELPDAARLSALAAALQTTETLQSMTPAGAAGALGKDLEAIYRFVRDEVAFESYAGALRGASGTLLARAGNALDQAILLKEMLDAAGFRTRIARGELSEENAARLIETIKPRWAGSESLSENDIRRLGLDPAQPAKDGFEYEQAVSRVIEAAVTAARADLAALGIPEAASTTRNAAAARDYWWVQLLEEDRSYDLHPAFPAGRAPAVVPQAVVNYVSSIPEHMFHWVNLRLFGERIEGKDLVRFKLLERKVLSAAVAWKTVAVGLRPELRGGEVILRPAVRTGELIMGGEEITVASSDGSPREGALTALWLEVSILSPLERPRFATITLADTLAPRGPVAEGAKAPAPKRSLVDSELGFAVELAVVSGALDGRVMLEMGAEQCGWIGEALAAGGESLASFAASGGFPSANPVLTHWAAMLADAWSSAAPRTAVYLDAPALACMLYRPVASAGGLKLRTEAGIMFLRTAAAGGSGGDRVPSGLIASRLLAEAAKLHAADADEVRSALPSSSGGSWLIVTRESLAKADIEGWSDETRLELEDDLLKRAVAAVSKDEKAEFWWRMEAGLEEPVARGPAGWLLRWRDCDAPGAGGEMQCGELLRALAAQGAGAGDAERAAGALRFFMERHLLKTAASPVGQILADGK